MPATLIKETDLVELLYQDKAGPLTVNADLLDGYIQGCIKLGQTPSFVAKPLPETVEQASKEWNIPDNYLAINLDIYFAEKVSTVQEAMRVAEELALFRERGLEPMLRFMIFLVDVMREHEIVWGVGRGSSVSSFLLYLVGIHQINPVKYNLGIEEFIR
jgi:DNA polymerase III alpha subunit